ncbi:Ribokinase-like protein [Xylariaceae sp. FL0255]|nr:Ribokinase-like protein [Xylariaceae sp. FL0255]
MAASKQTPPLITVLGSLNMDVVSYVSRCPEAGETLASESFALSPGGKGANQAVACAKLSRARTQEPGEESAHIRMLGAVGSDAYGSSLTANLQAHGVDVSGVGVSKDHTTGVAVIVVEKNGQNRIIFSAQANDSLRASEVTSLPSPFPDLLIMQLEITLPTVLAAMRAARTANVPVLLNPAPAQTLPPEAYQGLAHLVVNESEAATLAGVKGADLDTHSGLESVGAIFLGRGVKNLIITLGGRGVFYFADGGATKGLVPAEKANVVDTTAAGDTFVGQYALEIVGAGAGVAFDIEAAVKKANRAAAKTVERMGAQDSIPWRDEL